MSYLSKMYGRSRPGTTLSSTTQDKNPNRVLGGLRGQGADTMTVLGEDGTEHNIPSTKYVKGLEDKLRMQEQRLSALERKVRRGESHD